MNIESLFSIETLSYEFWGNTVEEYLIGLAILIGIVVLFRLFQTILIVRLESISKKTQTDLDDLAIRVIESFKAPFYYFSALYVAISYLSFPDIVDKIALVLFTILLSYYGVKALQVVVEYFIMRAVKDKDETHVPMGMIRTGIKAVIWILGGLFILSNLGIEITSFIAGLGIGGIAIALALQNILTDLFSSFAIYFDKPFEIGDFIIVGEHMGIVERIGIKTTRIRALQGEEIVISNKELTSTRIQNFKKMQERRVVFPFGVIYGTSNEKMNKIPSIVKEAVEKEESARFDRSHFKDFGNSSLNFESVYYILSGDYNEYMDVQERINLSVKEAFEKEGIEMAFPTQTIYIEK